MLADVLQALLERDHPGEADVLIYFLALANQLDIDLSTAVRGKLESGRRRFPIGYMPT